MHNVNAIEVNDKFNQGKKLGQNALLIYSVCTETDVVDNKPIIEDVSESLKRERYQKISSSVCLCRILCHILNLENRDWSILNTLFQYNRHLLHCGWCFSHGVTMFMLRIQSSISNPSHSGRSDTSCFITSNLNQHKWSLLNGLHLKLITVSFNITTINAAMTVSCLQQVRVRLPHRVD